MVDGSGSVSRHNLPIQMTPLIGREQEVAALCALIQRPEVRLVTLTGTGGIGKTRLGLQVASELVQKFVDGVYFVPLGSTSDPDLVISTLAQALGLRESGDWSLEEHLQAYLREKHLLLLLDNFEQVVAASPVLSALVATCPAVKIMVTSRAVLYLRGEYEFPVPPLSLPDAQHLEPLDALEQYPSVMLFLQRARAVRPDFQLTAANASTIVEICVRLDGLPLALELAAARMKLMPPQALLTRLQHRLEILTSASQDVPARQRTLRNTLAWSYDLLTAQEQRLFRLLSIFVGSFTLDAAEAICCARQDLELPLLDGIASLLDKSLLYQVEQEAGEPRFVMLETIREYGQECLDASGENGATKQAAVMYYLTLAERAEPHLASKEQRIWLQRLEQAYDDLRAVLSWLIEQEEATQSLRLACALWRFWWMKGRVTEGRNWLEQALALEQTGEAGAMALVRARALSALGTLAGQQGGLEHAERLCRESLTLSRQLGDTQSIITALWMLGYMAREKSDYSVAWTLAHESLQLSRDTDNIPGITFSLETLAAVALDQGKYQQARTLIKEGLALSRQVGDNWETARSLWLLALAQLFQGNIVKAQRLFEESLALSREMNDKRGSAYSLVMLGYVAYFQGQQSHMYALMQEALAFHKATGDRRGLAEALHGLGWATLARGDAVAAQDLFEESLVILRALDRKWFLTLALDGLAAAVAMQGQAAWGAKLWGAAEALREGIGATVSPVIQAPYEPFLMAARAQLSEQEFAAGWAAGRALVVDTVPSEALFSAPESVMKAALPRVSVGVVKYPAGLTAREVEVLRWVTLGLTDIQVAEKLVISPRTVSTHLTSIYNKLGVSSRSAATRFAMEHHLVQHEPPQEGRPYRSRPQ
ncbi:MAG TPA: tetratricopeptide repeat protein [Ktedonosporobacter sp.]|nr:tetratricopeptide repeat protein [Ktedonosporobacter sp.]